MKDMTEIICVIDRSGSMMSIRSDAMGGFNSFLDEQKKVKGKANLSLVLFNHEYELIHDGKTLSDVPMLNEISYKPSGTTALLDAVGRTIDSVGKRLAETDMNDRPNKVLFVILTDGFENASKDYTKSRIKEMVDLQRNEYNWEFIYLGANQDAFDEGTSLGIAGAMTMDFTSTSDGVRSAYAGLSNMTTKYRKGSDTDN